jgi:large conductance mechanosensitive channel
MGWLHEFKKFAMKGNVIDMAVGIIIGAGFGKIVNSLVGDLIMPVVGAMTGGGSFGDRFLWLSSAERPASLDLARQSGEPYIAWGPFVQAAIDFLIVAFAVFLLIKAINELQTRFDKKEEVAAAPPEPPEEVRLLREIRDSLQRGRV